MKTNTTISILAGVLCAAGPGSGEVILDADYTTAQGYTDGLLQSQNGWLGEAAAQVSTATGTATSTGAPSPFPGNVHGSGALGGTGGVPGNTAMFQQFDELKITFCYSFTLSSDLNWGLARVGIRDEGPNTANGFDSRPQQGFKTEYNKDDPNPSVSDDGSFRIYPDLNDTFLGNAMILEGSFVGISPGIEDESEADFQSDNLKIEYILTYDGVGNFKVSHLSVTNEVTALTATYTGPPQSFPWSATDAFLTQLLAYTGDPSFTGTTGGVVFEFFPAIETGIVITGVETVGSNLEVGFRAPPGSYILNGSTGLTPGSFGFVGGPVVISGGAPGTLIAAGVVNFENKFFVRVEEELP